MSMVARLFRGTMDDDHYKEDVDFFNTLHVGTNIEMKNGDCINVTLRQIQNT